MGLKTGRRTFLATLGAAAAGLFGSNKLDPAALAAAPSPSKMTKGGMSVDGNAICEIKSGFGSTGNPWAELGIKPMVNIEGTETVLGGTVMKPEVMELMRMGNMHFVVMDDLEVAAGKYVANLCKAPAGMTGLITGGAAASLVVGYAGMMTEDYSERIINIPDVTNFPKTEVIIQQGHRSGFDHQIRQCGAKLVVVKTRQEMVAAINPRTLAIHYTFSGDGEVSPQDTVAIAKDHGLYSYNDASDCLPPKERLWELPAMGFDITAFSGGKDICGPQTTGIMIGRPDLLHWALLNMSPQEDRIGRPCKVAKEAIFALIKATEIFVNQDYDATIKGYDDKAQTITNALAKYGVTMARVFNQTETSNVSPHYTWSWDPAKVNLTGQQVTAALAATMPVTIGQQPGPDTVSVRMRPDPNWPASAGGARGEGDDERRRGGNPNSIEFSCWLLKDCEDKYIADRLVEIFSAAVAPGSKPGAKKS
jgi:seryl-tRNA(Sec) selenium transferase